MNQKSKTASLKEFRCPKCHSLLYKYKIHSTTIEIETKCYSDNVFSVFRIELKPLFELWSNLNKEEQNKVKTNDKGRHLI